jgi:hypothetical protein
VFGAVLLDRLSLPVPGEIVLLARSWLSPLPVDYFAWKLARRLRYGAPPRAAGPRQIHSPVRHLGHVADIRPHQIAYDALTTLGETSQGVDVAGLDELRRVAEVEQGDVGDGGPTSTRVSLVPKCSRSARYFRSIAMPGALERI